MFICLAHTTMIIHMDTNMDMGTTMGMDMLIKRTGTFMTRRKMLINMRVTIIHMDMITMMKNALMGMGVMITVTGMIMVIQRPVSVRAMGKLVITTDTPKPKSWYTIVRHLLVLETLMPFILTKNYLRLQRIREMSICVRPTCM